MEKIFGKTIPSVVKDPFSASCIESIALHADRGLFNRKMKFWGKVYFKNGETGGEQKFYADSLGELYTKIQDFCLSLEK